MTPTKVPLFAGLDAVVTQPSSRKSVDLSQVDELARANDFPSRPVATGALPDTGKPSAGGKLPATEQTIRRRRYTTGRNMQLNIKATPDTVRQMGELADRMGVPLGVVLERALASLAASFDR
ncbi:hypothetical protein ACG04R_16590 [Roseateles sp. BYS78W]|uniref:Stability/partitioning determinant n=1 Tax=Pelomonas candidula TaxID=3299025 RepID=A0ABW7HEQ9_9BURK